MDNKKTVLIILAIIVVAAITTLTICFSMGTFASVKNRNVPKKQEIKEETYKYEIKDSKDGVVEISEDNNYTITIDGDYSLFKSLKVNDEEFIKDVDYTVSKGSTIIRFTDQGIEKLKPLKEDKINIVVSYENNKEVSSELYLKVKEYYCEDGYELNDTKCIKAESIKAKSTASCDSGELMKNKCVNTNEPVSSAGLGCPSGYKYMVVTDSCVNEQTGDEAAATGESCSHMNKGEDYLMNGSCYSYTTPNYTYSCDEGYTLDGKNCIKEEIIDALVK